MTGSDLMRCVDAAHAAVLLHKEEIATLDQNIGDGDHVFNLIRGIEALQNMRGEIEPMGLTAALKTAAKKLLEAVGGSSGPLLATLLLGMSKATGTDDTDHGALARGFAEGVSGMQMRGKAGRGEKTMLDVLIPVSETFSRLSSDGASQATILKALKWEAQRGMEATRDLIATKGRASFLGERAIGHIDPGARSSQLIIAAVCDLFAAPVTTADTRGVTLETRAAG